MKLVDMERILVVCRELAMSEELTFFLQHSGFQVARAADSGQVIAEMAWSAPDLILIRENNRRLNGDELCVRIRELSDVPIIVLGHGQNEADGVEMLEMGADAYLVTPLDARDLLARIRALLRRSRALQPNTTDEDDLEDAG